MNSRIACLALGVAVAACQDAPTGSPGIDPATPEAFRAANVDIPVQAQRRLGVATYNLYLGGDPGPVIAAPNAAAAIVAAAGAWAHVQVTDFRVRAGAIARAIANEHPHLVGLEEVATWQTGSSPTGSFTTQYDFLQLVLDSLQALGKRYRTVVTNPNFVITFPVSLTMTSWVRWYEDNAIIVRDDLGDEFFVTNPVSVVYQAHLPLTIMGQPFALTRGYATVDVKFRGKWIRFAATHLESYHTLVRMGQAAQLAAALAASPYDVILVGDLNSHRDFAGDSWQILTGAGFTDVWTESMPGANGYTASFGDDLVGPWTELDHTVDYILRRSAGTLVGVAGTGEVLGDEVADQTANGWWPSDHAGVYAVVRILKN
jgi:endonuclease/exonuclease/phosphatase family metal-dependent hydrolase